MIKRKGAIQRVSFSFAIHIVNQCKQLTKEKKEFIMSKQLLRSRTAVGALTREAQNARPTSFISLEWHK
jgi:four helix bundle protein